ncbi:unnamed protein product [Darwinula stevensoni]|uniref:Anti-proliferative protein domain-containing protein n=1 Tax=Darwinula stevensoni TaxID=69355 RepID=A0A7R8XCR1_9CRUS|nr:unnamed protein product [Darwinula stevensoni]CAG0892251.1 unnamed protein product [Darwinula stevensoni]
MHIEVQVALNFVISYLYNKLPRRRVNIFGEELEKALREKFQGHWYPEKPFKGSAYRCLKTSDPVDPVLEKSARESGMDLVDIRENLPGDMSVWIDPGEVSYRIGEKGQIKILYSEKEDRDGDERLDREVTKTFNPEAQCFKPIDSLGLSNSLSSLSLSPPPLPTPNGGSTGNLAAPIPSISAGESSPSPTTFLPVMSTSQLTFTTATFAQTKFGSTKLKTNSKRPNRMSPTEFSHYIKQRAMLQQHQRGKQTQLLQAGAMGNAGWPGCFNPPPPQRPRSLSPFDPYVHAQQRVPSDFNDVVGQGDLNFPSASLHGISVNGDRQLVDSINLGVSNLAFASGNNAQQFQHLLMAN